VGGHAESMGFSEIFRKQIFRLMILYTHECCKLNRCAVAVAGGVIEQRLRLPF
jgi:hypothetical protein